MDSLRVYYMARGSLAETLSAFIACDVIAHTTGELPRQRELSHGAMRSLNGYLRYVRRQQQDHQEYGDRLLGEETPEYAIVPKPTEEL